MADIVELYEFNDNGTYYTFAPTILTVNFNGKDFTPSLISRDRINIGDNILKNVVNISLPRTNSFARSLLVNLPTSPIIFTLYRNGGKFYQGKVISAEGSGLFIKIACISSYSKSTRPGITARVQISCRHVLYGLNCGAVKDSFSTISNISTVNSDGVNFVLTSLAQADHFFLNGEMQIGSDRRRIIRQVGTAIKVNYPFKTTPATGDAVTLFPGCDHTETTCFNKFNNILNYGGASKLPLKDPHSSSGLL